MIKFFRQIRQELLSENKIWKYLKYALGEIVLVVIGILIALQINNWNDNRKELMRSKEYLEEIVKDLKLDTTNYNFSIAKLSSDIAIEEWALSQSTYSINQMDSVWKSFGGFYWENPMNDRTFQKIQNSGNSTLLGFEPLSDELTFYYTEMRNLLDSYTTWDKREVTQRQEYMRDLEHVIEISNYQLAILGKGLVKKNFETRQDSLQIKSLSIDFINSTRGRNHLKNNYTRHLRLKNVFERLNQNALSLIAKIEVELAD
ncbi:DUF6090 family protein [Namhaeicola litoreus]|uniref:DUF6090 family protein n=1 Tax=Namhaeicola litoreus TaxID=1052145 RepID=A0ABW3Y2D2_9FLAO